MGRKGQQDGTELELVNLHPQPCGDDEQSGRALQDGFRYALPVGYYEPSVAAVAPERLVTHEVRMPAAYGVNTGVRDGPRAADVEGQHLVDIDGHQRAAVIGVLGEGDG